MGLSVGKQVTYKLHWCSLFSLNCLVSLTNKGNKLSKINEEVICLSLKIVEPFVTQMIAS